MRWKRNTSFTTHLIFLLVGCILYISVTLALPLHARSTDTDEQSSRRYRVLEPLGIHMPIILNEWPYISPTPTSTLPYGVVMISEVYYNPFGDEPDGEWLEIYNAGGVTVELRRYKVGDASSPGENEGMMKFPVPARIGPGQVIVVAHRADRFTATYGFKPDYEMKDTDPQVANMVEYGSWASHPVELTNGGDEVILLNNSDTVIDAVSWGSSTFAFTPSVDCVVEGNSIERYPPYQDTQTRLDWREQGYPSPGSIDLIPPSPTPSPTRTITRTPTLTTTPTRTLVPTMFTGKLLISEVVYQPAGAEPAGEWLEIYNPGLARLYLTDFKLGDEETRGGTEGMLRFPAAAFIDPGQVIVVANQAVAYSAMYGFLPDYEIVNTAPGVPDMQNYLTWGTGSLLLNNNGDEVILLDGREDIIDAISYAGSLVFLNPSIPGVTASHSIERYPPDQDTDTAFDWRDQINPSAGSVDLTPPDPTKTTTPTRTVTSTATPTQTLQPTPVSGRLLVSEVLYDPVGTEPDAEFVEVYNAGGAAVDLSFYKIGDEETLGGNTEGMLIFPLGANIEPGQVVVVANMATIFQSTYGFNPDYEMVDTHPSIPDLAKYIDWASGDVNLHNDGDQVIILDSNNYIADAMSWGTSNWAFEPSATDVAEGHSLVRVPADQDTDTAGDWYDQEIPNPGQVEMSVTERLNRDIRSFIRLGCPLVDLFWSFLGLSTPLSCLPGG